MKFAVEDFLSKLPLPATERWKGGVSFIEAFSKGNFQLELFAPREKDYQTPHERDEFCIVARGGAELIVKDETFRCAVSDALFVPAKVEHHFENMSNDFAAWVIFF